mgnify:CR=1 FL=1
MRVAPGTGSAIPIECAKHCRLSHPTLVLAVRTGVGSETKHLLPRSILALLLFPLAGAPDFLIAHVAPKQETVKQGGPFRAVDRAERDPVKVVTGRVPGCPSRTPLVLAVGSFQPCWPFRRWSEKPGAYMCKARRLPWTMPHTGASGTLSASGADDQHCHQSDQSPVQWPLMLTGLASETAPIRGRRGSVTGRMIRPIGSYLFLEAR